MPCQCSTLVDATTMLVSSDGVLVCLLLLICIFLGDVTEAAYKCTVQLYFCTYVLYNGTFGAPD